ncbi:MAG: GDP-mannose 4,6-dehydratase [Thermoanaerobaculia bacterium]|nr:GDP-mannose 4,6-dehydratase [Thermoanaerobaculia bacterium]MCZ7651767.1 GDP-mannose 4,6-dehydratase [Thermoanaerobaculia bacterium]
MRILVTGATGFLGRHLVGSLRAAGHEVAGTGLGRDGAPDLHELDIRDERAVARLLAEVRPGAVAHLAALSHVGESWQRPDEYFAVNVLGVEHLLRHAGGARVLFVSSAEVYGAVPEEAQPIPEERPVAPRTPYAMTKAAAERLAVGAGAVVARCFNLLGSGQTPNFALPSFAAQLAAIAAGRAEPRLRVGNLSARRDFVNVKDAAEAALLLLERGEPGGIYNVASGEARSIAELLAALQELSGVAAPTEIDPERLRPVDIPLLCGDASRLRALGWRPAHGVDAALAALWEEARARAGSGP